MRDKLFSYHWIYGFKTHTTEDEAINQVNQYLALETEDFAAPSENIFWGEIKQQAKIKSTGQDIEFNGRVGELMVYELEPDEY